jgi:protein O-GlcNAc transferase
MDTSLLQLAVHHHRQGKLADAESLYRQLLSQQPTLAVALNFLGYLCHQTGRSAEGLDLLNRSIELDPGVPEFQNKLAAVLGEMSRLEASAAALRHGLMAHPDYAPFYVNLGVILEKLGQFEQAEQTYRRALTLGRADALLHTNLAGSLTKLHRPSEAEDSLRTAIVLDPTYVPAWQNLGKLLREQGRQAEAVAALRQAVALRPADAALYSELLHALPYCPDVTAAQVLQEHRNWAERHEKPLTRLWHAHNNNPTSDRRLRVGYMSPDFRRHSVTTYLEAAPHPRDVTIAFKGDRRHAHPETITRGGLAIIRKRVQRNVDLIEGLEIPKMIQVS